MASFAPNINGILESSPSSSLVSFSNINDPQYGHSLDKYKSALFQIIHPQNPGTKSEVLFGSPVSFCQVSTRELLCISRNNLDLRTGDMQLYLSSPNNSKGNYTSIGSNTASEFQFHPVNKVRQIGSFVHNSDSFAAFHPDTNSYLTEGTLLIKDYIGTHPGQKTVYASPISKTFLIVHRWTSQPSAADLSHLMVSSLLSFGHIESGTVLIGETTDSAESSITDTDTGVTQDSAAPKTYSLSQSDATLLRRRKFEAFDMKQVFQLEIISSPEEYDAPVPDPFEGLQEEFFRLNQQSKLLEKGFGELGAGLKQFGSLFDPVSIGKNLRISDRTSSDIATRNSREDEDNISKAKEQNFLREAKNAAAAERHVAMLKNGSDSVFFNTWYRIKHVPTGKFLAIEPTDACFMENDVNSTRLEPVGGSAQEAKQSFIGTFGNLGKLGTLGNLGNLGIGNLGKDIGKLGEKVGLNYIGDALKGAQKLTKDAAKGISKGVGQLGGQLGQLGSKAMTPEQLEQEENQFTSCQDKINKSLAPVVKVVLTSELNSASSWKLSPLRSEDIDADSSSTPVANRTLLRFQNRLKHNYADYFLSLTEKTNIPVASSAGGLADSWGIFSIPQFWDSLFFSSQAIISKIKDFLHTIQDKYITELGKETKRLRDAKDATTSDTADYQRILVIEQTISRTVLAAVWDTKTVNAAIRLFLLFVQMFPIALPSSDIVNAVSSGSQPSGSTSGPGPSLGSSIDEIVASFVSKGADLQRAGVLVDALLYENAFIQPASSNSSYGFTTDAWKNKTVTCLQHICASQNVFSIFAQFFQILTTIPKSPFIAQHSDAASSRGAMSLSSAMQNSASAKLVISSDSGEDKRLKNHVELLRLGRIIWLAIRCIIHRNFASSRNFDTHCQKFTSYIWASPESWFAEPTIADFYSIHPKYLVRHTNEEFIYNWIAFANSRQIQDLILPILLLCQLSTGSNIWLTQGISTESTDVSESGKSSSLGDGNPSSGGTDGSDRSDGLPVPHSDHLQTRQNIISKYLFSSKFCRLLHSYSISSANHVLLISGKDYADSTGGAASMSSPGSGASLGKGSSTGTGTNSKSGQIGSKSQSLQSSAKDSCNMADLRFSHETLFKVSCLKSTLRLFEYKKRPASEIQRQYKSCLAAAHLAILNLFSAISFGLNHVNETKMRQHLPLNSLLKVLQSQTVDTPFKSKLLVLIYHVHVEASLNSPFFVSTVFIWNGKDIPSQTSLKSETVEITDDGESASLSPSITSSLSNNANANANVAQSQSFPLMDLLTKNVETITTALIGSTELSYDKLHFLSKSLSVIRALFKFQMCYSVNDPTTLVLFQHMSHILNYKIRNTDDNGNILSSGCRDVCWCQRLEATKYEILKIFDHLSDVFLEIRLNELFRYATQISVDPNNHSNTVESQSQLQSIQHHGSDSHEGQDMFGNIDPDRINSIITENSLFTLLPNLSSIFQNLLVQGEHRGLNQLIVRLLYCEYLPFSTTFAHLKEIKVLTGVSVQERSKLVNTKLVFIRKIIVDSSLISQQKRLLETLVDSMLLFLFNDAHLQSLGLSSLNPSSNKLDILTDPLFCQIQPEAKMQDLMRDISATETIFELLSKCTDPILTKKSLRFLTFLSFKNPRNQHVCLSYLPILLSFIHKEDSEALDASNSTSTSTTTQTAVTLHDSVESKTVLPTLWVTLRCIFQNNPFAQSIDHTSITLLFNLVKDSTYPIAYRIEILKLFSFLTIVTTKSTKQPSKANQHLIINWVIQNFPHFSSELNLSNPTTCNSQPFVKAFVTLLANCAYRRNSSAQTICRTLLSLTSCLDVLRSRSVPLETKEAYWKFLGCVYTDTSLQSLLPSEMNLFEIYISLFTTMTDSISKNSNPFSFSNYLSTLLDTFDAFSKSFLSVSSWNTDGTGGNTGTGTGTGTSSEGSGVASTDSKSSNSNRELSLWYEAHIKRHVLSSIPILLKLAESFSTVPSITRKLRSILTVIYNSSIITLSAENTTAVDSWLTEHSEVDSDQVLAELDTEWKWKSFISSLVCSSARLVFQSVFNYNLLLDSFDSTHFKPYFDPLSDHNVSFIVAVLDSVRALVNFNPKYVEVEESSEPLETLPAAADSSSTASTSLPSLSKLAGAIISEHPNQVVQTRINSFGGTSMILGLLEHPSLLIRYKAFFTLQTLLNEGNPHVQKTVLQAIESGQSSLISSIESLMYDFLELAQTSPWWLQDELILKNRFDKRQEVEPLEDEEDDTLEEQVANFYPPLNVMVYPFQIFRVTFSFLIQLAEGHNLRAQNLLSTLLPHILSVFGAYIPPSLPSPFSAFFAQKPAFYASNVVHEWYFDLNIILDTLIEVTQGPCIANQKLILQQGGSSIVNLYSSNNSFQTFYSSNSHWINPKKYSNVTDSPQNQAESFVRFFVATEFERQMISKLSILTTSLFEGGFASTAGQYLNRVKLAEQLAPTISAAGNILLWATSMLEQNKKLLQRTNFEGIEHNDAFTDVGEESSSMFSIGERAVEHANIIWWRESCEELLSNVMGLYIVVSHLSYWNTVSLGTNNDTTSPVAVSVPVDVSGSDGTTESGSGSGSGSVNDADNAETDQTSSNQHEPEKPTKSLSDGPLVGGPRQTRFALPIDHRVSQFLEHKLGYIEITRDGELENVYFTRHDLSELVTESDKHKIMFGVDRSTPSDKINDFQDSVRDLYEHLKLRHETTKNPTWKAITNEKLQKTVRLVVNTLVFIINILLVLLSTVGEHSSTLPESTAIRIAITILGIPVLVGYIFISITFFGVEGKHLITGDSFKSRLKNFFSEFQGIYQVSLIVFAALGVIWPWWFAFHVLDLFKNSSVLITILQSVSKNAYSIILTFLLVLLVVYYFAILAFLYFSQYFGPETDTGDPIGCYSVLECFGFIIGTLASGEIIEGATTSVSQFFFQITFFLIVVIILLNITFAIIIDSFGALRDERNAILEDMSTKAFISSLDSSLFERNGISFESHSKFEHNPWYYLDYFIYLHEKNVADGGVTEFTGQESLIWANYKADTINFYPIGSAGSLSRIISQDRQGAAEQSRTQFSKIQTNLDSMWKHVENLEKSNRAKDALLSKLKLRLDRQIEKSINMADKNAAVMAEYIDTLRKQEEERSEKDRSLFGRKNAK